MSLRHKHCRVVKLADTPSCLGGGEIGKNHLANHSVKVRILPLQQTTSLHQKGGFFIGYIKAALKILQATFIGALFNIPNKKSPHHDSFNGLFNILLQGGGKEPYVSRFAGYAATVHHPVIDK